MILLFTFDDYYPIGGAEDLKIVANSLDEVIVKLLEKDPHLDGQNAHAFDTGSKTFVGFWTRGWSDDDPWVPVEDWRGGGEYRCEIMDLRT